MLTCPLRSSPPCLRFIFKVHFKNLRILVLNPRCSFTPFSFLFASSFFSSIFVNFFNHLLPGPFHPTEAKDFAALTSLITHRNQINRIYGRIKAHHNIVQPSISHGERHLLALSRHDVQTGCHFIYFLRRPLYLNIVNKLSPVHQQFIHRFIKLKVL